MRRKFYNFITNKSKMRFQKEKDISNNKRSIKASANSPKRFEIMLQKQITENEKNKSKFVFGLLINIPHFIGSFKGVNRSILSIDENTFLPKKRVSEDFLRKFEKQAYLQGVSDIGYTTINPMYIFKDKAVLYNGVIVLTKEMDKKILDKAPSLKSQKLVWNSHNQLGKITNELTNFLRKNGYGAQAGPPLGGLSIYPALGEKASIGAVGKHGLLISPKYGARQRIAVIYTSIENLPLKNNNHLWIKDFCMYCNKCVRSCPANAIYNNKEKYNNGLEKNINSNKCLEEFINNYGCTICAKVCPFSNQDYMKIKANFKKLDKVKG